jgi:hypothetical protein
MVLTEADLRAFWQNGQRALPSFPPGTRLTPSAQDFLKDHDLTLTYAEPAPVPVSSEIPAVLRARLEAWQALAALVAAQARHHHLPSLAVRLDDLASVGLTPYSVLKLPTPGEAVRAAVPAPGHVILYWLRLLQAEARSVAALAQEGPVAHPPLADRLEVLVSEIQSLEHRFLSGELAWSVGAS